MFDLTTTSNSSEFGEGVVTITQPSRRSALAPDEKASVAKLRHPGKARSESLNLPHSKSLLKTFDKGFSGKFLKREKDQKSSLNRSVNSPESPRDIESYLLNCNTLNLENRGRNLTRRESFSEEEEAVVRSRSPSPKEKDLKRAQIIPNATNLTHPTIVRPTSTSSSSSDPQLRLKLDEPVERNLNAVSVNIPQLEITIASPLQSLPTPSLSSQPATTAIPFSGRTVSYPNLNTADAASLTQSVFSLSIAVSDTLDMLERVLAQQLSLPPTIGTEPGSVPVVTMEMLTNARNALRDVEVSLPKNLLASSESSSSMPSSAPTTQRAPSMQKLRVPFARDSHFFRNISGSDSAQTPSTVPILPTQNVAEVAATQATIALGTAQKKSPKGSRRTGTGKDLPVPDLMQLPAEPKHQQHSPRNKRRRSKGSPTRGKEKEKEEREKSEPERQSRPRRMSTPNIAARSGDKKSISSSHHINTNSNSSRSADPRGIPDDSIAQSLRNSNRTNDYLNAKLNTLIAIESNNKTNSNIDAFITSPAPDEEAQEANITNNKRSFVEPLMLETLIPTEIRIHTPPEQTSPTAAHPSILSLSDPHPGPQRAQSAPSTHRLRVSSCSPERDFVAALLSSDDFEDVRNYQPPRSLPPMRLTVSPSQSPSSSLSSSPSGSANDLLANPNRVPTNNTNDPSAALNTINNANAGDDAVFRVNLELAEGYNSGQDSSRNSSRVSSSSCSDEPVRVLNLGTVDQGSEGVAKLT